MKTFSGATVCASSSVASARTDLPRRSGLPGPEPNTYVPRDAERPGARPRGWSMETRSAPSLLLSGRLEAIPLADVVQVLAHAGRDGVLVAESEDPRARGEIELIQGRVVRAEAKPAPRRLGTILVHRGTVDIDTLDRALLRQSSAAPWKPIGTVLLEMGALDAQELARGLEEQIEAAVAEILAWNRGVFRFRGWGAEERTGLAHEVGVALDAHELVLESVRRWDEASAPRLS